MPRIVFLEVDSEDAAPVREAFPDAAIFPTPLEGNAIAAACRDAEIVSTFISSPWPRATLQKLPSLRLLCTRSVGYNHIDLAACAAQDVTVCNVPDYGSHVIAEHVFALLLGTLRHIREGAARTEHGHFDYHGLRGIALRGKTIGIVGTGKIGQCVARIAHGFGMRILGTDQCRTLDLEETYGLRYVPLEELLAQSNIISLHLPASDATHHIIDTRAFAAMQDGVILVNTARGELIDSAALLSALCAGKVRHALLDVLEHEQNFAENKVLLTHPAVVATPHIAFYADDSMRNMYSDCFQSIREFLSGSMPEHAVKPPRVVCDLPPLRK